jgi:hypothetical protein
LGIGDGDPGLVRDELRALEARKRDLKRTLAANYEERAVELHLNIADLYRKKVKELQSLLTDETDRPQAIEIIRSMVERIEVHKGKERGKPDVILVGALHKSSPSTSKRIPPFPMEATVGFYWLRGQDLAETDIRLLFRFDRGGGAINSSCYQACCQFKARSPVRDLQNLLTGIFGLCTQNIIRSFDIAARNVQFRT